MRAMMGLVMALVMSLARPAWAQPVEGRDGELASGAEAALERERKPLFTDSPFAFGVRAGFGTNAGLLGLVTEYNLVQPLAVGVGVGLSGLGFEYGAHARVRPIVLTSLKGQLHAVTLEAALSRTRYSSLLDFNFGICEGDSNDPQDGCYDPPRAPAWVWWVAGDVGWETKWSSGFSLRVAAGAAALMSDDPGCVVQHEPAPCRRGSTASRWLPTFSATVMQSF